MIRYEIVSNAASSEVGLHRFPELLDLAESLRLGGVEAYFVRHVRKVEGDVHLAAGQFARGVTVTTRATREIAPHHSLAGAATWMRAVLSRPDRGLHLHLDSLRAANSTPFSMAQIFGRRQRVFVSGVDGAGWARLCAIPDLTCQQVPEAIAGSEAAKTELLHRRNRPAGFASQARLLATLPLLPNELRETLKALAQNRDAEALRALSDAQIINLGLIGDLVERYAPLVEQFCLELEGAEVLGDLGQQFDQLTQGISIRRVVTMLAPLVAENRRGQAKDKRTLANDLRIGLRLEPGKHSAALRERMGALVYRERARQDGALYRHASWLAPIEQELERPLKELRAWMLPQVEDLPDVVRQPQPGTAELPPPAKEPLFALLVGLIYRGQFLQKADAPVGPDAALARAVLARVKLPRFDITPLQRLNPRLPAGSYAKNLAQRAPLNGVEGAALRDALLRGMFPSYALAAPLLKAIQGGIQERESARIAHAAERYLMESYPLLRLSNYVLGRARLTSLQWRALMMAGRSLGLAILEARGEAGAPRTGEESGDLPQVLGHTYLFKEETHQLFPLKADGELTYRAYRHLISRQVVTLVRRFVSGKLSYLVDRHGPQLFEQIYQHVTWEAGLDLSRQQLGRLLLEARVFEPERLRTFGFSEDLGELATAEENPLLTVQKPGAPPPQSPPAFTPETIAEAYQEAQAAMTAMLSAYGNVTARKGGAEGKGESLGQALAGLARDERFDLRLPDVKERLAATEEAVLLHRLLEQIAETQSDLLPDAEERREAVSLRLPGALAQLAQLRAVHDLPLQEGSCRVILLPAPGLKAADLDLPEQTLAEQLSVAMSSKDGAPLKPALERLAAHHRAWRGLLRFSTVAVVDHALRATLLSLVETRPPAPAEVAMMPPGQVLLMAPSAGDAARFHRLARRGEPPPFETLSGLASELASFQRLRDELEYIAGMVGDLLDVIGSLNVSDFEAPHLVGYRRALQKLREMLATPPEDFTPEVLTAVEAQARDVSARVRDIYSRENALPLRNRWLTRIAYRLRIIRPNSRLTFADRLFEREAPPPKDDEKASARKNEPEYQTFSERVRQLLAFRERLAQTGVFVISPAGTQQRLTLTLIETLFRLKGLEVPILVDTANCGNFLAALQTRLPPYRFFHLDELPAR